MYCCCCCCQVASVVSDSVWPHRLQPTKVPCPWDSPDKNTGVGCHFLLQCMRVESEREVGQSCPTQRLHGLQPTRLLRPWDFPGKGTGVGCHSFANYKKYKILIRWPSGSKWNIETVEKELATQLFKIQKMEILSPLILMFLEKQCNPPGTWLSLLSNEVQSGDQ